MAQAEVIPIEITAKDSTAAAWSSLQQHAKQSQDALKKLTEGLEFLSKSGGGFSGVGQAVSVLQNPMAKIIGAFVGLGAAGYEAYKQLEEYRNLPFKEASENQVKMLNLVRDAYSGAAGEAGKFLRESKAVIELQTMMDMKVMGDKLRTQMGAFNSEFHRGMAISEFGQIDTFVDKKFEPFIAAIDKLSASAARGTPALDEFRNEVAEIGKSDTALSGVAVDIIKLSQGMSDLAFKLKELEAMRRILRGVGTDEDRDIAGIKNKADPFNANEFQRTINTVSKHIAIMEADARAVDLAAGAHESLRVQAQINEAITRRGLPVTSEEAESFRLLKERAGEAADALARAKIASQIKVDRSTLFLSETDRQIAQQLKDLYGTDIPAALASIEAQAMRTNQALRGFSSSLETGVTSEFVSLFSGAKNAQDAVKGLKDVFVRSLTEMLVKTQIMMPTMKALQTLMESFNAFGFFSAVSGAPGSPLQLVPSALGNVFASGNVIPFAHGGLVDRPTLFPMATGAGLMGEAGPEAIMPLARGSDGKLGVRSGGGGAVTVNVINAPAGTSADVKTSRDANGSMRIDVRLFGDLIAGEVARGDSPLNKAMEHTYGLDRTRGMSR